MKYFNCFKPSITFSKRTTARTFLYFNIYWDNFIGISLTVFGYGFYAKIKLHDVSR